MTEMLQTYRGVYLDINKSDLCVLKYGVFFYFCSKYVRDKFENQVEDYVKEKLRRLKNVLPNTVINEEFLGLPLAIEYYRYVEKRGIRIETNHGARIKTGHLMGDVEFEEVKGE